VSPNSDLYREHPEWTYREEGLDHRLVRDQRVLDLSNPDAFAWVQRTLRGLLTDHPISFLKWDMTRPITAPRRTLDVPAAEWSFTHTHAYYQLLKMIRAEFPHVTVEGCAGGAGRLDNAVLGLIDVVWGSDATGPRDRLRIQDGFLRAYPPHVMSSWVTEAVGELDRAAASFEFRFVVAMAGSLGIGGNLTNWSDDQRASAKTLVALYRELRPLLHHAELYRHSSPNHTGYALEYVGGAEHDGRIVVLAYDSSRERSGPAPVSELSITPPVRIRLLGVDPRTRYRVRSTGEIHSGAVLHSAGLTVPWAIAPDADVVVLDPL
jgi:alpha-galactosidase